ncbi:MAG: extracellular solute-binding protein, partial [Acetatifactor sp.]|nr:extracellular solute-binding protein [Acetatifactor sp.]
VLPEETSSYIITEADLPFPGDALTRDVLKGDNWVASEKEYRVWNGSLYRLLDLFEMVEDKNIYAGACVQVLASPYDRWENHAIFYQEEEEVSGLLVKSLIGAVENGVLLEMTSSKDGKSRLVRFDWGSGLEVLVEMPAGFNSDGLWGDKLFWRQEEKSWVFSSGGKALTVLDQTGQQESSQNLSVGVVGVLNNPQSGEEVWYGFDQKELVLWDQPGGRELARVTDQIDPTRDYAIGYSPEGELYLADPDRVWAYDGNALREVFSFGEKDCFLQELYWLGFGEDGVMMFLGRCDGIQCLLTALAGPTLEKQEVLLVVNNVNSALSKLAARYNRKSREYHVTVIAAEEQPEPEEYRMRIQTQLVTGEGPDLLGDWVVDVQSCVDQGCLEPLEGIVEDRSLFVETALAAGERNGELYGIPYECHPYFLAVSRQLADASSWTLEQMYQAVRSSPAQVLEEGQDGVQIVMAYGLHDEENKAFIDWEKGESHLTEEPFLDLMAFAKEYADQRDFCDDWLESLADGRTAGMLVVLDSPEALCKTEIYFNGEISCIGYPRESGSGIYMEAQRLYLNRNAGNKEGALDFLRYLVSEEGQRWYMDYNSLGYEQMNYDSWMRLSVRRSLVQKGLDLYQSQNHESTSYFIGGASYHPEKLDEEQVETFWRILDSAYPAVFCSDDIWFIVEEELQSYFSGMRSAEEAAATLHSRVQLYLDERK